MDTQDHTTQQVDEAGTPYTASPQSAISTKVFLALGFITITAIVAGAASILALNRFQQNFDTLIGSELPTLQDTAHISQLSVTMASRGASLIISPNTWTRVNLMGQVADDAQWLEEILARMSTKALSENRRQELLLLKEQLFQIYNALNTQTENRIIYGERLADIDRELMELQQDLVAVQASTSLPDGTFVPSGPLAQWNANIHAMIFTIMEARRLEHPAPLKGLEDKVLGALNDISRQIEYLPGEARLDAQDIFQRLFGIVRGPNGVFHVLETDFDASNQIEATLRRARTVAENFMSASELATGEIRAAINATNQGTSRSMDIILQAMVGFILVSTLVAVATFFYVNSTVLKRLSGLRRSMVAHAEGEHITIDTSGNDEITDMAQSLKYLVDTLNSREQGLTQAKEEAESASTAKTRFLAAASHDLRQPLQALNLFVYALEGKERDEEKREIISMIRNSLDSLKELLNTLLDISKLEAGVVQANMKDFPAGPMIERIRSELTAIAWANDLELKTVASSAVVHSDPSLLETIVRNLVDNAIKYTEQGKVLVGCRRRDGRVRFEVWDTGAGIPEEQRELIFQDFYQVDNEARRRTHGLGLGLSIVRRMARLVGCEVGCESQLGKGSVFWVEVPLAASEHPEERRSHPRQADEAVAPSRDAHIVLIEDDDQVLTGIKALLESQGYTVQPFHTADSHLFEGTFAVKKRPPDLVIADYRLEAEVTGREAIAMIRDIWGQDIPGIIITGDTAPERLREAKRSGFPILHKPVRPEELLTTIRSVLADNAPQDDRDAEA